MKELGCDVMAVLRDVTGCGWRLSKKVIDDAHAEPRSSREAVELIAEIGNVETPRSDSELTTY